MGKSENFSENSSMKNLILLFFVFYLISGFPVLSKTSNYKIHSPDEISEITENNNYEKILFIVDFSNSMNEYLGGRKKIDIAINAIANITSRLNPAIYTGLRVYGHKNGFNQIIGCNASDLVTPIRSNNARNINFALSKIRATGWTPITRSLKNAVNLDFAGISGDKRIILLTDGGENCDESPCDYAISLVQTRDDIKIDVIEFAIDDPLADSQLKCTALTTSGKVYRADDAESLARSLEQALNITKDVQGVIIKK